MAGSLSHIVGKDGRFTMDLIENLGDAHEALEECYSIIRHLSGYDTSRVRDACRKFRYVDPWENEFGDNPKKDMR